MPRPSTPSEPSPLPPPARWVWAGAGVGAHLIPEERWTSSNPHALCRRRVRNPRRSWERICPDCLRLARTGEQVCEDPPASRVR